MTATPEPVKREARRRAGPPALELIEAAVHLLRTAPAGGLLAYYVGSVPCLLGLLYFWADMSGGAFAREHLLGASLSAALLYLWMKCWHAVFASKLQVHLVGGHEAPWTFARVLRLVSIQAAVQPSGLFLRLLAAQVLIPYVWTYAFYQNVGILGDGTKAGIGDLIRQAARQARLWPKQAHAALSLLFVFAFFVWLNICMAFAVAPRLLQMFLGIETVFSRDLSTMLNTTTFAATLAAAYLCFDPIRKGVFVLRCFHGASLKTGDDLRVELRSWSRSSRAAAAAMLFAACFLGSMAPARAADPKPVQVGSAELNDSMDRVLQRREYAWRLPRKESAEEGEKGWFETFFDDLWKKVTGTVREVRHQFEEWKKWFRKLFHREINKEEDAGGSSGFDGSGMAQLTLTVLVIALAVILCVLLWRWRRGRAVETATALPKVAAVDLREEDVTADQLPEDGWLGLARELMEKGELRLALRAFYLATLAHLARRELIRLGRSKSNRDYDGELQRRARGHAGLLEAFDENLLVFERAWYGEHAVTPATLDGFSRNLERIRAC